jgi:hypothetical protein
MLARARLLISVLSIVLLSVATASAQRPCLAKTCTQAYHACTTTRCAEVRGQNCPIFCRSELERCLTTGEFRGHVCMLSGLIKK